VSNEQRRRQKAAATKPTPLYAAMEEGQCSVASRRGWKKKKEEGSDLKVGHYNNDGVLSASDRSGGL